MSDDWYEAIEDICEPVKCPCIWGDVVSPAISYGEGDNIAIACIDCLRTTEFRTLSSDADVQALFEEWKAVCARG